MTSYLTSQQPSNPMSTYVVFPETLVDPAWYTDSGGTHH